MGTVHSGLHYAALCTIIRQALVGLVRQPCALLCVHRSRRKVRYTNAPSAFPPRPKFHSLSKTLLSRLAAAFVLFGCFDRTHNLKLPPANGFSRFHHFVQRHLGPAIVRSLQITITWQPMPKCNGSKYIAHLIYYLHLLRYSLTI